MIGKRIFSLALISGLIMVSSTATASSSLTNTSNSPESPIGFGNVASKGESTTQEFRTYSYPGKSPSIYSPGTIGIQIVPETPGDIYVYVYKVNSDGSEASAGLTRFDGGVGNVSKVYKFNVPGYVRFEVRDINGGHGKYNVVF
ncbi:hypothetical protein [Paenibacillus wulumuqiensis]|uniref:hypothetical protein n=1 Tax=Paenibacillus wulumuqiensis TaxID=1567107 RepID=UPI00061913B4|nr:hypothetical protein [Paenibacillus wulumuqiensis]